jgi:hypothetical protein
LIKTTNEGNKMTPEQKIKHAVLLRVVGWKEEPLSVEVTDDNIDELYDNLVEADEHWDGVSDIRGGEVETNIPCEFSRHYESESVAAKMPDGTYVGWTYWFGGGKHGCPQEIEWMSEAYDLECVEEQKLVTVQTFTKVE